MVVYNSNSITMVLPAMSILRNTNLKTIVTLTPLFVRLQDFVFVETIALSMNVLIRELSVTTLHTVHVMNENHNTL